jgi:RHS repeat-associated protein
MTTIMRFCSLALAGALSIGPASEANACNPMPDCMYPTAPTIKLTSPTIGATTPEPGSFTLSADASDPDGSVAAVEFFVNGASVGIDGTSPYSMIYGGLVAGSYTIQAKVTDDEGTAVMSGSRTVTVTSAINAAPTVSMTGPANNSTFTAPATIVLTASAADSDGSIVSVTFKSGSATLGTPDTTYPYSYSYSGAGAGVYTFTAVATDNKGATATSAPITVTVNSASGVAPTATLTSPTGGSYAFGATITVNASASDTDGSVTQVQFLANGAVIGTDTSSPYSIIYAPTHGGSYTLTAVATDNSGSSGVSNAVTISVAAPAAVSETRSYAYDQYHRLCKTINPESGSTVVEYDAAGNVWWTADGQPLPNTTSCNRESVPDTAKTTRIYDAMNRVTQVVTPNTSANVLTEYDLGSAVTKITASNPGGNRVVTEYKYNTRRLLTEETQTNYLENDPIHAVPYDVNYSYDANAHLAKIGYPDLEVVDYAPDGLGRPTQVVGTSAAYASGITYYANGAMSGFKYGSAAGGGPTHEMMQNARQLPWRSHDYKGTTNILDDTYSYDANGNITFINDGAQTGTASQTRGMGYDGLDRLTAAAGPWGNATYSFDALDNLRSADQGTRQFRYNYDASWHLANIKSPAGTQLYSFGYDLQGNVTNKGNQVFVFDSANRMTSATTISGTTGLQSYRYDGLGRRVQTTDPGTINPPMTFWLYTQAGQVLYTYEGRRNQSVSYIYLNGSQIATRTKPTTGLATVRYQMTDALGSPVASTNTAGGAASIQRTGYTPWGEPSPSVDGTGYTAHVMDANTGLTYMQQRYYDPQVGRFLSIDPMAVDKETGWNANRFAYGMNNPAKFVDPDGRKVAVSGNAASVDELMDAAAQITGLALTVKNGQVSYSGASSAPNLAAQALMKAIDAKETVEMVAVSSSTDVNVDQFSTKMVDSSDLQSFTDKSSMLGQAMLVHIISERLFAAQSGSDELTSHIHAIKDESEVMGATTRQVGGLKRGPDGSLLLQIGSPLQWIYKNEAGNVVRQYRVTPDADGTLR